MTLLQRLRDSCPLQTNGHYSGLRGEEEIASDDTPKSAYSVSLPARAFSLNAWFLTTLVLSISVIYQWTEQMDSRDLIWNTANTDTTRSLLKLEKRRFTYGLRDDADGNLFISKNPNERQYVGSPNPQIDHNWNELLDGRYFQLDDSEVSLLNEDSDLPTLSQIPKQQGVPNTGYYGGVDMLHSLHCLNSVRKHLDMGYYADSMEFPNEYRRMHIDHCIDHLRQSLLCHGDLTPVTLKLVLANTSLPYPVTIVVGETEREHTCRNEDAIRSWVSARGQRSGSIVLKAD